MKRLFGILFLVSIVLNSNAQLLWKVSGNGIKQPSYIFGTHHLASLSIIDSIQGLRPAFNEANRMIGEMVLSETQSPQSIQLMQEMMMMPADTTLNMLFTTDDYELVNKYVKEHLKFDMKDMPNLRPAFISNNIIVMLYLKHHPEFNPKLQMDTFFQSQAKQKGKKIIGLETMEFQCKLLLSSTTLQRQADLLVCTLKDINKAVDVTQRLTTAYMNQKLDTMLKISEEKEQSKCDPLPEEMEAMVDNRNREWVKQLPALFVEDSNFVAVGALHLPGKNGLVNLLRKEGFLVEAVD
ncbi:TraB/GumN family protein [Bacteroides sp. 224]|uniref:TraB/GumN family protein n=1 Tax=Bacteroides sp. 224 TaxID=2302936 RepID=UPI0013D2987C|nr:TraB/GumN family protein [Bacteroides sp. 224]NDV64939.1 TraB/GumN family protein [Bacteroides sp. 224]